MFMDQKNQYSENEYTSQSNLQIQCNPYLATNGFFFVVVVVVVVFCFFTELEQIISQSVWKQKTSSSQSNLEKEEWNWRNQTA